MTAKNDEASKELGASGEWLRIHTCHTAPDLLSLMPARLYAGEVECVMLARQMGADFLLLDDNAAKKTARYLGFRVLGTLACW